MEASDRAIAALEIVDNSQARRALAGVYNNRALILFGRGQYEAALGYSDKMLAILKDALHASEKELQPFLADNRKIREKLRRP